MGNEIIDRTKILGRESTDFDKVLRGYDPKQVDEYIENLIKSNKNATAIFDQRLEDSKNENSMLRCELEQKTKQLTVLEDKYKFAEEERERFAKKANESTVKTVVDDSALKELQEKYDSLVSKNRLLAEENRNLAKDKSDLQRDVAHLTKKVDKNRNEIKSLKEELEAGMSSDADKKYSEIAQIYESAIDKAEDLIYRLQTEFSLAHSKAEDVNAE